MESPTDKSDTISVDPFCSCSQNGNNKKPETMKDSSHDLIIIGTGGAAMAAGIEARSRGKSVLLNEQAVIGGTCLNVGCVPSKMLLAASRVRKHALSHPFPAVSINVNHVDLSALMRQKTKLIDDLRKAKYVDVAVSHGFPFMRGHAMFIDEQNIPVNGQQMTALAYVIATGAAPAKPDIQGIENVDYLTSTSAMEQEDLPKSLIVVGAGYVGLEQAQLWAQMGVCVTLVGRFAPHGEPELSSLLRGIFESDGIHVIEEHAISVAKMEGCVCLRTATRQVTADRLLVATGRIPNTSDLGLEAAGVKTDERGFILVDDNHRTTNPRIFAAGDVSGARQFVYVAAQTGHTAAAGALGQLATVDYRGLPSVTFTVPQLASAGLTEAQARTMGHPCDSRLLLAQDIPRALINGDTRGALKMVIDTATGQVLGVHALLDGAGDVMLAATYLVKYGLTVEDAASTWAPYLTMSEGLRIVAGLFRSSKPTSCCS